MVGSRPPQVFTLLTADHMTRMNRKVEQEQPRSFGLSVGTVCCLLAGLSAWRSRPTLGVVFGVIGLTLVGGALVAPTLLRAPSRVWWRIARALAWFNTRVILSAVFVVLFTPLGCLLRVAGRDVLKRRWRRDSPGWVSYPARHRESKHFERMY